MIAAKLVVASIAPNQSSGCALPSPPPRLSGIRGASASTSSASGRFSTKINRQDQTCSSHPPATGPTAANTLVHADQVPIARPRSSPENDADRIERPCGISRAAPMPCTARAATSCPSESDAAQPAEASANSVTPHT